MQIKLIMKASDFAEYEILYIALKKGDGFFLI